MKKIELICDRCKRSFTLTRPGLSIIHVNDKNEPDDLPCDLCDECQWFLKNWIMQYDEKWQDIIEQRPYFKSDDPLLVKLLEDSKKI